VFASKLASYLDAVDRAMEINLRSLPIIAGASAPLFTRPPLVFAALIAYIALILSLELDLHSRSLHIPQSSQSIDRHTAYVSPAQI
jgi:hypothetical protein